MTAVVNPKTGVLTQVIQCRTCHADVYWGYTSRGKRCPYDVVDGEPTEVSHFATCPQAKDWSTRTRKTLA